MNVLPGWRGTQSAPKQSGQLWSVHPDWFMVDAANKRMQPCKSWYNFLSPHHPEAREHLKRVFAEVAGNYKIDGIHLDYFRFPSDYPANQVYKKVDAAQLRKHKDFSYDQAALEQFRKSTGKRPSEAPDAWDRFRRESLTTLLCDIRSVVHKERPGLVLSCAVIADPDKGRDMYFQDSTHWLTTNLLDLVFPMNYHKNTFDAYLTKYCGKVGEQWTGRVAAGISLDHPAKELRRQIALTRERRLAGVALFAYSSIFKNHKPLPAATSVKEILNAR
ncbi:MAG: family 10 glycosylhydrolase, partial [bacterium]